MATTTNNVKSVRMDLVRKGSSLTISHECGKSLNLNLNLYNMAAPSLFSEEEKALVERLTEGLLDNIMDKVDLTTQEMQSLLAIRNKSEGKPVNPIAEVKKTALEETNARIYNHTTTKTLATSIGGVNATERKILGLQKVTDIYSGNFWQMEYDIPTVLQKLGHKKGGVDNPSDWFWLHAMRLTNSCWVFPESSFSNQEVQEWMDDARGKQHVTTRRIPVRLEDGSWGHVERTEVKKVKITVIKYDRDQIATLKEKAATELQETLVGYHHGLIENIMNADAALQKAIEEINEKLGKSELTELAGSAAIREEEDYRNNTVRKHLANSIERMEMLMRSAEMFDLTGDTKDLFDAFRQSIITESTIFNEMAEARKVKFAPMPKTPAPEVKNVNPHIKSA